LPLIIGKWQTFGFLTLFTRRESQILAYAAQLRLLSPEDFQCRQYTKRQVYQGQTELRCL